jgi:hypothetical protein
MRCLLVVGIGGAKEDMRSKLCPAPFLGRSGVKYMCSPSHCKCPLPPASILKNLKNHRYDSYGDARFATSKPIKNSARKSQMKTQRI